MLQSEETECAKTRRSESDVAGAEDSIACKGQHRWGQEPAQVRSRLESPPSQRAGSIPFIFIDAALSTP